MPPVNHLFYQQKAITVQEPLSAELHLEKGLGLQILIGTM